MCVVQVNEKGQVVAKSPLLKELGSLEEETGLKCCICLEGYRSHPQKVREREGEGGRERGRERGRGAKGRDRL